MAIVYCIDASGLVRITVTGMVSAAEVTDFLETLGADAALRPAAPQLVDLRGMAQAASIADVELIAATYERMTTQFAGARCAMLVGTPVMFGVARQFGTLVERAHVEAAPFTNERDAWEWLGAERRPGSERAGS